METMLQLPDCPRVNAEECEWLQRPFSEDEVIRTTNLCAVDKAPGPDGFTIGFFKECWEVIREDVMQTIHNFHQKEVF